MTQELVANVRLRSVQWHGMVPNILGAEEDTEGQTIQEVPGRQQPGHGPHSEIALFQQKLANVFLLRNLITAVAAVFLHELHRFL